MISLLAFVAIAVGAFGLSFLPFLLADLFSALYTRAGKIVAGYIRTGAVAENTAVLQNSVVSQF